ncbi:MAG: outer membrane lipoprotein carrier protein LolA [Gracilimonas sp.]|nr:outer membrane lipoprotein carrier protein LolA [Gracilimonas sp.]
MNHLSSLDLNLWFGMHNGTSGSRKVGKVVTLFIALFLITASSLYAQTPTFDLLKERFETGEVFAADFDHTYTDSYTGESTSSDGQIWIDQVSYKLMADGQTIVVDGETSRVYDEDRNRVIIDNYYPEEDDFAPSRMLSGIDSTYAVSERKRGSLTLVTLTSTDDFSVFAEVEILLDADLRPLRIIAIDISDNEIVTNFSTGRFYAPESNLFQLEYPEDAEIVDMRY